MPTRNTDSFPRCSRLRQVRIYVLTEFFLKISNDNSMWCTASTLGVISAATAVCHDVWVGTEREPSKEVMQPRGASLWHPQELSIPVLPGDHISLGFRFRIFTTQRKIVFWYLNTGLPWWLKWQKKKKKNQKTKKRLPARRETHFQILDQEGPLQEGMATHSSILAWRIPWTEEYGRLWSMELQRVRHNWATFTFKHILVHPPAPWKMQKVGAYRSTCWFLISTVSLVKCRPALDSIHPF